MTSRPVVLTVVARGLYPALLIASVLLLLRGHNDPGGGFIGGMVAVAATALRAVSVGSRRAMTPYPGGSVRVAAAGVGLAAASGLPALVAGRPFLTHLWSGGPVPLSTVFVFDAGVYLVVWGALGGIVTKMIALDEQEHSQ